MTIFLRRPIETSSLERLDLVEMKPTDQSADPASHLPELHSDDANLDLRDIVRARLAYGVHPTDAEMARLRDRGYTSYFLTIAKSSHRIGGRTFKKLRDAGRLDLTTEYVLFHCFRDRLDPDIRRRIASILAASVSHPHARWEGGDRAEEADRKSVLSVTTATLN